LEPGYYLAKPAKVDGFRVVIFKQNGRVIGVIPAYQKEKVNPEIIFPTPPKPQRGFVSGVFSNVLGIAGYPFKIASGVWPFKNVIDKIKNLRRPLAPPRAKAEFREEGNGKYYDMWLYVEDNLYKMLFKFENK
jgi:hypothetical protein